MLVGVVFPDEFEYLLESELVLTLLLWYRQHAHHKLEISSLLPAQFGTLLCIAFEQSLHQLEAHIDLYALFRSGVFLQLVVAVCHIDQFRSTVTHWNTT